MQHNIITKNIIFETEIFCIINYIDVFGKKKSRIWSIQN